MLKRISRILYGAVPAEFASDYPLDESVARLDAACRSVFSIGLKVAAKGRVSESRVVLQRSVPLVRNSFKPFFVGRFEQRPGQVVLVGEFTMHWPVKVFMTFWLGFCLLWTLMATSAVIGQPDKWFMPLAGVGMFGAGLVFVRIAQWMARGDAAWLAEHIRGALALKART